MKFTAATKAVTEKISIAVINDTLNVAHSYGHPKDDEIRKGLLAAGYRINQGRGRIYTVTGGTQSELEQIKNELDIEYGLVATVDDVALLSRIVIEIAIGASKTNGMRLDSDNFPPGFDAIKAAQSGGFMNVCLETARNILEILK